MNIWMTVEQHKLMLHIIEKLPYEVLVCGMRVHGTKNNPDPREPYIPRMDFCLKGTGMIPKEKIQVFKSKMQEVNINFDVFDYHRCSEEMQKKIDLYAVEFSKTYPEKKETPPKQWPSE